MNQLLRLAVLLFMATQSLAQAPYEYINSPQQVSYNQASAVIDNELYVAGGRGTCYSANLRKLDQEGRTLLEAGPGFGYWRFDGIRYIPDENIILAGGYFRIADDFNSDINGPRIIAYRENSTDALFDLTIPSYRMLSDNSPLAFTVDGQNEIALLESDTLYKITLEGTIIHKESYTGRSFTAITTLNDSTLLAGTANGELVWMDNEGKILASDFPFAAGDAIIILKTIDGQVYGNTSSRVFEVLSRQILPSPVLEIFVEITSTPVINNICGNQQSLFVWGYDNGQLEIFEYDLILERRTGKISMNFEEVEITDISASESQLFICGNLKRPISPQSTAFTKAINILDPNTYNDDISLEEVRIVSDWEITYDTMYGEAVVTYSATPMIYEYDVRNLGPDTVNSLAFYSNVFAGFNCATERIYNYRNNFVLPPGQSVTLTNSRNYSATFRADFNGVPHLDFSVFAPNYHFDTNQDNNKIEQDLVLSTNDEHLFIASAIKLYPNPVDQELTIGLPPAADGESLQVMVLDIGGRKIIERFFPKGQTNEVLQIATSAFPSGMYFVQVRIAENFINKKVLIQH
ncbi:MAG: T9SS type A sorting domain-containing protein [Bacteroidota bacterium]